MTEAEAVDKARRLAREKGITLDPADIRDSLPEAPRRLARLSLTADWRDRLEHDYELEISDRSASFASETDLLSDSIAYCDHITHPSITDPDTGDLLPFRIQKKVSDLNYARAIPQSLFAFAAVSASAVEFRAPVELTGDLTVRAVRIPKVNPSTFVIDNLPSQLEDIFIDIIVDLAAKQAA